ncbi:MAG: DMT family transporter [Pyrinomonadaceae bacterium]|nr:DMT family transporter [Pyrinomonadaceae bacterium]
MTNIYILIAVALIAGAVIPTQTALNNKMAGAVSSPILAALVSFLVGTTTILIYALASGERVASLADAKYAPPTAWLGGVLGAFFVASTIILLPRLGVVLTISLVIAGQLIMSLMIDHFGLLGLPVKEISVPRLVGIALVAIGAIIIRKF